MEEQILFSVFTPVYNRKSTIHRVWESLLSQTYRNFEWIVVDDGSTDGVYELLEEYKSKADFKVVLLKQENKGKHSAWNRAVELAKGELFLPADSDDSFVPTTLERFIYHWTVSITDENRHKFSGINVLCKDPETGKIVGNSFPENLLVSNNLDLFYRHKVRGEKWGCIRTDVLRERPNKEVKGSYLSESWIWFYIARKYSVLCVNEALRNYYTDHEICLSKPKMNDIIRSKESRYTYLSWHLSANKDYILKYESSVTISKRFIQLWLFGLLSGKKVLKILGELESKSVKALALVFFIPGMFQFLVTLLKIKRSK